MPTLIELKIAGLNRGNWFPKEPDAFLTVADAYAQRREGQTFLRVTSWIGDDAMQLPAGLQWFCFQDVEGAPERYPVRSRVEVRDGVYDWRPFALAHDDVVAMHEGWGNTCPDE